MRKYIFSAALSLFLSLPFLALSIPFSAHAEASIPAGFAPGTLWLSKTSATAGDDIKIFTVVYDSTSAPIEGDVVFKADSLQLGSQHFKLAAGESQIIAQPWTAVEGAHTFSASLESVSGIASALSSATSNVAEITVASAPPSPIDTLTNSVTALASSSPAVQSAIGAVIGTTEDLRKKGADWLSDALYSDQSIASSTASTTAAASGKVLGAETFRAPVGQNSVGGGFFATAKHWLLTVLLAVFQIQWLFYVMLLVVLYIVFKIIQGFFRYRS